MPAPGTGARTGASVWTPVGWGFVQRIQNAFHDSGKVGIHIRIPEPKNSEALRHKKGVTSVIRLRSLMQPVLTSICFDDQPASEANEVDDIGTNGRLSAEIDPERLQLPQLHPQFDFLRRETFTKCAGNFVSQDSPCSLL